MERPIRILQVLGRLDRGGAETMVMNLYRHMDRSRIQFDFVIHTKDVCDYTEEVIRLGGNIYSMEPFGVSTFLSYRRKWKRFFKEHPEYAIVHGHMRSTASIYLQEAKRAGCIAIAHSHNTSSGKGFSAFVKNVLQYPIRYRADYLFSCSRLAGIWLYGEAACCSSRFMLLNNGITPDIFAPQKETRSLVRKQLGVLEQERMLLHVGRLEPQKNQCFLLQMVHFLKDNKIKTNFKLFLCGVGPLEKNLKEQAAELGLDEQVVFLGIREDIPKLMQAADMMVFPSLFEGLPVTLVEAQAAGLPILMADTITEEVILTDLVRTCSLQESPLIWAQLTLQILQEFDGKDRSGYGEQITAAGYNVAQNAQWLSDFYQSLIRY